jgi:hypothetical protein
MARVASPIPVCPPSKACGLTARCRRERRRSGRRRRCSVPGSARHRRTNQRSRRPALCVPGSFCVVHTEDSDGVRTSLCVSFCRCSVGYFEGTGSGRGLKRRTHALLGWPLDFSRQAEEILEGQHAVLAGDIVPFLDFQELDMAIQEGRIVMIGPTMPFRQCLCLIVGMRFWLPLVDPTVVADQEYA